KVPNPFFVGTDNEPWTLVGTAAAQDTLVGVNVVLPPLSLLKVSRREFPLLCRIAKPLLNSPLLLVFADVKKELQDRDIVLTQHSFEVVDLIISLRLNRLRHKLMDSDDQHILIVGAVENTHLTSGGNHLVNSP